MWKFTGVGMLPLTSMSIYQVYATSLRITMQVLYSMDVYPLRNRHIFTLYRLPVFVEKFGHLMPWVSVFLAESNPKTQKICFFATAPSCSDVAIPSGVRFWHELRTCPGHFHNNFLGILRCLPWEPSLLPMKFGGKCRVIETWFGRFRIQPQVANLAGKIVIKTMINHHDHSNLSRPW